MQAGSELKLVLVHFDSCTEVGHYKVVLKEKAIGCKNYVFEQAICEAQGPVQIDVTASE